ncbi:hypothetical protein BGZ61DRAFT_350034 [Ilyonectria robusta]|uniref:uncharacterized protein n=1 Tax=Ilyonectria robusta TaxID=1079257 RepID=UPI001E8E16CD|nr:uncharacterized protein BGZ61DRAFT_350034 [Ilyonectria robusta]KAH8706683.1 hypothetical protein BGZ61DRAFT_350034 [Ilyonectria robusta]
MAPWSSRRGSQPSNHSSSDLISRIHHSALNTSATLSPSLGSRFDISNAHADSSDSDADFHAEHSRLKARRPQHSRSMSQPFPSLFSGKKKKRQSSVGGLPPDLGFVDDDAVLPPPPRPTTKTHTRGGPAGSKDFATGNCMTCGSLVRWPRDLKVFKCTICMTVNDLERQTADSQGSGGSRWRRDASQGPSNGAQPAPSRVQYISVEHTRRLVHQCIHSHLTRKLGSTPARAPENPTAPRNMLSFGSRIQANDHGLRPSDAGQNGVTYGTSPSIHISQHLFDEEPTLRANPLRMNSEPVRRPHSTSYPERPLVQYGSFDDKPRAHQRSLSRSPDDGPKRIFKPLEDYIIACFGTFECVNSSFMAHHLRHTSRVGSEPVRRKPVPSVPPVPQREPPRVPQDVHESREPRDQREQPNPDAVAWDLDPKLLLLGDFAENGTWWTGGQEEVAPPIKTPPIRSETGPVKPSVSTRSPQINWSDVISWYSVVTNVAEGWFNVYEELSRGEDFKGSTDQELQMVERDLLHAQDHCRRVLLKATELLLKRPGRPLKDAADLRFLLIILENPLLHRDHQHFRGVLQLDTESSAAEKEASQSKKSTKPESGPLSGQHSGIIKRILGLMSNSSIECHNQLITWFAKYQLARFAKTKELASDFLTYRLLRQSEKKPEVVKVDITAGLVPQMQEGRSGAYLYDEIGPTSSSKKPKESVKKIAYSEDWQIKASSRLLALLFAANNLPHVRRGDEGSSSANDNLGAVRDGVYAQGQMLPTSDFYNSMIDYADLVADFENWEARRGKFSFCQYPFLLSIWAKNRILEYDARRQMQSKARDAFFDSIMSRRSVNQFLVLDVRRDCLVDDSLQAVSEVIGSGSEDIKKGLRIVFKGEEGVDAGGLRKEWFLLLVREVFNPDHGMFLYDEDSQYCYFNPNAFETSDQFFLVGVVMGLAIYNSTILDVALPPFAFRKLIASAPTHGTGASAHPRPAMRYNLEDLAEYRPRLARGLRQLLEFEGDVEVTFCLDFVIETEKYGTNVQIPLCPGGERIPVTNSNRREYVDLYTRYILDVAVTRQFEPFKRGFYTVCGGNALSLFRPEEIELLVRGSDEELDITSLRGVAEYDNWGSKNPDGSEPVISWFWETFQAATPEDQRKLLLFITGSDRIPAMGTALLPIKISCLGDDTTRFPMARTCFNFLSLSRYESKEKLEKMLWTAVHESEGFGLK